MDLNFSPEDEAFRVEARAWLEASLIGEFAPLRGRGGPGDEHADIDARRAWERKLGAAGWACIGWPKEYGGRGATLMEQVIFTEEMAKAGAPPLANVLGLALIGPTIIAFGTDVQKKRFLPPIASCDELWCQGYSEPNAGSDLAAVRTRAAVVGDDWVITGQKIWTSLAHCAEWCFVLCRTDADAPKHKGLSYLLVPMNQPGVDVRPIAQMTGTSEFNEVFFDGAKTAKDNIVGPVNGGWKIALATLPFERGASTLGQQLAFRNELDAIIAIAKKNGRANDPLVRQRIADAWIGLEIMRMNALRTLSLMQGGELGREAMIAKLYWANWHQSLGKLAMDVLGDEAEIGDGMPYSLTALQRFFLFTRSDTIYAGSNEIQRNIIAERALGLPPEPRAK